MSFKKAFIFHVFYFFLVGYQFLSDDPSSQYPIVQEKNNLDVLEAKKSLNCFNADGVISCGKYKGRSVLQIAALGGFYEFVDRAPRNLIYAYGQDALHTSVALGDFVFFKKLLNKAKQMGLDDKGDYRIFQYSINASVHPVVTAVSAGSLEMTSYFLEEGFNPNTFLENGMTLFDISLLDKDIPMMNLLIKKGYVVDCSRRLKNKEELFYRHLAKNRGKEFVDFIKNICKK